MRRFCLVLALLLLSACSGKEPATTTATTAEQKPQAPKPPTVPQARETIASAGEFGQFEFTNAAISVPVAGSSMNAPTRELLQQLSAAGWVALDGSGDLMLTDKSRSDKRFLLRENGLLDVVPLAKKEMGEVTAVRPNPDGTVTAEFTWKWVPNEVGASLKRGPVHDRFAAPHAARANLIWNGTEWTVVTIDPV